ncbi:MAG: hypothetical protein ACJ763_10595, partial [Bdellovibrionia bacterium]
YDPNEALRILNQLGLRHKLMQIGGSANEVGTLSSWLNKYPLPVKPEGQAPDGALTAEKLGIKQVAHETNDFAHRLISWRYDSLPRAFISRKDHPGETAVFGRGFYTAKGTNAGAYSNGRGLPIVFDVDPNAVEGKDFVRFGDQDGVLWLNGSRLKARQETREYSPAVCVTQHLTQVGVAPAVVGSSRRPPDRLSLAVLGGGSLFILLEKLTSKSKQTPSQPTAQSSTQAQDASANGATPAAVSPCLSALKSVGLQGSSAENFCDRDPTPAQIDLLKKIVNKVRTKQWSWSNDALAWISSITDNVSFDCVNQIIDTDFLNPSQTSVLRFCSDVKNIHQSSTLSKISADVRDKRLRWSEDTLQRLSMIQDNQSLNCVDQVVGMNYFNPTHSSVLNFCSAVENADQVEALAKVAGYVRDRNLQWSDDALNGILSVRDKLSLDCINKVIAADYLNPSQSSVLNFCTQVKNINQSDALSKIAAYVRDNRLQWNNDAFGGVLYLTDNASFDCVDRVIAAKYFNPSHNSVLNFCSNVKNFAQSDALKKIATYVRDNRLQWNNDAFGGVLYLNDNLAFECIDKVIAANYFNPAHSSVLNFCSGVENANQIAALSKIVSYVRDKNLQWSDGALTGISGLRDKLAVDCIDKVVASDYLNPSHSSVLNFCSQVNDARQSAALGKIATYVREKKLRWNNDVFSTLSWMKSPQTDCVLNEISRGGDAFVALKRCQSSGP